ncbi:membrane-associated progesterone receptor component 1-like [Harmonia axyridis]|uniref:membrane-associated progesterone receptor component 1-like n=1 Tax=Harmonia axyridis TaxID=115357 RepID=UPI001E2798E4|nr:membrane-associated progesterone receptor component 1-like [Harmonia axyridis]
MAENASESGNILTSVLSEIIESPLNIALVILIAVLVYKIVKSRTHVPSASIPEPKLPKLKKRDFTVQELNKFDGTQEDGRILIAVNGNVYDVTKGKRFYGPGGPYAAFGGKDASRGLATFSVSVKTEEYDDLSDLNSIEMDSVREWEAQFKEKYELVGKLLKPGEEPTNYSDEEDESSAATTAGGAGDRSKED